VSRHWGNYSAWAVRLLAVAAHGAPFLIASEVRTVYGLGFFFFFFFARILAEQDLET
jgi:hypothetical protein